MKNTRKTIPVLMPTYNQEIKDELCKVCPQCQTRKNLSFFNKRSGERNHQVRAWCKECESKKCKKWREDNPELYSQIKKDYNVRNPDKVLHWTRRRKFRLRADNRDGFFVLSEWRELKNKHGNMCLCCKKTEPEIKITADHIIPLSKGGSNDIKNIQPLCFRCNLLKGVKTISYA